MTETLGPRITITYCTQCRWLLRAAWLAQELLTTFTVEIGEVALRPGTGGVFRISIDGREVWDRKVDGGFPEIGRLKRLVRDHVAPERGLGHLDRADGDPAPGPDA
jgi:selenoprotein W-related protein